MSSHHNLSERHAIQPQCPLVKHLGITTKQFCKEGIHLQSESLDDCQITHLTCVRLKHLLYNFFQGVFWAF